MRKKKVLFVCVHNSARSVIAEAMLNCLCGEHYEAQSAGLRPTSETVVNPLAVAVLAEDGIDASDYQPRHVFDVVKSETLFRTSSRFATARMRRECGANAERCPIFPGVMQRLHWGFPDPSSLNGTHAEKLAAMRQIRDGIKAHIENEFCAIRCV